MARRDTLGNRIALEPRMVRDRRFVDVLQSCRTPGRYYTGLTHTETGRPWKSVVVIEFASQARAIELERYLKSGSGVAFSKRHLR